MAGVLLVDVLQGMVIGLVASMLFVIYRTARPHVSSLGRVPGVPGAYSDLQRHPENLPVPGVLIVRPDAQIYYANALAVRDRVKALIADAEPPVRVVILDASAQDEIDITSTDVLIGLIKALRAKGIEWYVADVHAPVLERGRETGLLDEIGPEYVFPTLDAAVNKAEKPEKTDAPQTKTERGARSTRPVVRPRRNLRLQTAIRWLYPCRQTRVERRQSPERETIALNAVVQTQDLTVFNVTKAAVGQAQVMDQLPPIAGKQRETFVPVFADSSRVGGRGAYTARRSYADRLIVAQACA